MLRNTPTIPGCNKLCEVTLPVYGLPEEKIQKEHSPTIICPLHHQQQIISSLPFAARIRKINLPPVPSYCKIIHEGHFPPLNGCLGGQQQFYFT